MLTLTDEPQHEVSRIGREHSWVGLDKKRARDKDGVKGKSRFELYTVKIQPAVAFQKAVWAIVQIRCQVIQY